MFGKSSEDAHKICNMIENDQVKKTYLAKVENKFPESENEYKLSKFYHESKLKYIKWEDNTIIVTIPTDIASYKNGLYECNDNGKSTITKFIFEKYYDDNYSIVKCIPVTGRTHQIRLHLKYLGFPISNDPLYNPKIECIHSEIKPFLDYNIVEKDKYEWNDICPFCIIKQKGENEIEAGFCDSQLKFNEIYLHALQYESKDWKYTTPNPYWYN